MDNYGSFHGFLYVYQVQKFPKDEMFAQLAEGESSDSTAWEPIQSMVSVTPRRFDGKPILGSGGNYPLVI